MRDKRQRKRMYSRWHLFTWVCYSGEGSPKHVLSELSLVSAAYCRFYLTVSCSISVQTFQVWLQTGFYILSHCKRTVCVGEEQTLYFTGPFRFWFLKKSSYILQNYTIQILNRLCSLMHYPVLRMMEIRFSVFGRHDGNGTYNVRGPTGHGQASLSRGLPSDSVRLVSN